jgi:hypothetical protein
MDAPVCIEGYDKRPHAGTPGVREAWSSGLGQISKSIPLAMFNVAAKVR